MAQPCDSQAEIFHFPGPRSMMIRFIFCSALALLLNIPEFAPRDSISEGKEESGGGKGHEKVGYKIELTVPPSKHGWTTGVLKGWAPPRQEGVAFDC